MKLRDLCAALQAEFVIEYRAGRNAVTDIALLEFMEQQMGKPDGELELGMPCHPDESKGEISALPVIDLYNRLCPSMPRASLTLGRRKAIFTRWKEQVRPMEFFDKLFRNSEASDFLSGRSRPPGSSWRCNIDWILTASNAVNIIEGKYENTRSGSNRSFKQSTDLSGVTDK